LGQGCDSGHQNLQPGPGQRV